MIRLMLWIVAGILSLSFAIFAAANRHDVRIDLWPLPWSAEIPLFVLILLPFLLGLTIGSAVSIANRIVTAWQLKRMHVKASSLERQLVAATHGASPHSQT